MFNNNIDKLKKIKRKIIIEIIKRKERKKITKRKRKKGNEIEVFFMFLLFFGWRKLF